VLAAEIPCHIDGSFSAKGKPDITLPPRPAGFKRSICRLARHSRDFILLMSPPCDWEGAASPRGAFMEPGVHEVADLLDGRRDGAVPRPV
jgi:hypothetical protein